MRMDCFKKAEAAIEMVLTDYGMVCYGILVDAYQAKYLVAEGSGKRQLAEPLTKCVESLVRDFGPDTGLEFYMYPGDGFLAPYLLVRDTETGVWP